MIICYNNQKELKSCALENLVIAAGENNFKSKISIISKNGIAEYIEVSLFESDVKIKDELFNYIEKRQSTRNIYDRRTIAEQDLNNLQESANFSGITM